MWRAVALRARRPPRTTRPALDSAFQKRIPASATLPLRDRATRSAGAALFNPLHSRIARAIARPIARTIAPVHTPTEGVPASCAARAARCPPASQSRRRAARRPPASQSQEARGRGAQGVQAGQAALVVQPAGPEVRAGGRPGQGGDHGGRAEQQRAPDRRAAGVRGDIPGARPPPPACAWPCLGPLWQPRRAAGSRHTPKRVIKASAVVGQRSATPEPRASSMCPADVPRVRRKHTLPRRCGSKTTRQRARAPSRASARARLRG